MKLLGLFLLTTICLTGCSFIITAPEIQVQSITPVGISTTGLTISADLLVNNPNPFDLTLLDYSYTLQIATLPLSSGTTQQTTTFPAHQQTLIKIPVKILHTDLLQIVKLQPDLDAIPYHLSANLHVHTPLGGTSLPVNKHGDFSLPENYRPHSLIQRLKGLLMPL